MHAIKLVLLAALAAAALPAAAQWQWIDAQGHKVFSDRAPPADIPAKNILRQPSGTAPAASTAPAQAAAPSAAAPSAAATAPAPAAPAAAGAPGTAAARNDNAPGTDKALEEQKRKAQAQEAAKAKTEQARVAKERQENCARARQSKSVLNSGQLLANTNAQGERGFMDETTRAAELKRADAVIAANCDAR